tara:strand:- start:152 stop:448 length:297 start_codon:yes stop_codon:yes gene_type:complete
MKNSPFTNMGRRIIAIKMTMHEVRIYDKDGNLKETVPPDVASKQYWEKFGETTMGISRRRAEYKKRGVDPKFRGQSQFGSSATPIESDKLPNCTEKGE